MPYSIVRPTIVFGNEDILVNNMAWLMRKFPIFPIFGSGQYTVQPVYVGDLAPIAVAGAHDSAAGLFDVIGPETFTFKDFVKQIASQIQPSVKLVHVSPRLG